MASANGIVTLLLGNENAQDAPRHRPRSSPQEVPSRPSPWGTLTETGSQTWRWRIQAPIRSQYYWVTGAGDSPQLPRARPLEAILRALPWRTSMATVSRTWAVTSRGSNTVTILMGNGDGTFTAAGVSTAHRRSTRGRRRGRLQRGRHPGPGYSRRWRDGAAGQGGRNLYRWRRGPATNDIDASITVGDFLTGTAFRTWAVPNTVSMYGSQRDRGGDVGQRRRNIYGYNCGSWAGIPATVHQDTSCREILRRNWPLRSGLNRSYTPSMRAAPNSR